MLTTRIPRHVTALALTVALGAAAACERAKSSTPLSPTVAGPIAGVVITAPEPMTPAVNQRIRDAEQPVTLVFRNPTSNGVRPFTLTLQVAADYGFTNVAYSQTGIAPAVDGTNRVRLPDRLQGGRVYFWRVRADDGANSSEWSAPLSFEILQPIVIGVPEPLSPIANARATSANAELRVRNGISSGQLTPLDYHFQVAANAAFTGSLPTKRCSRAGAKPPTVSRSR